MSILFCGMVANFCAWCTHEISVSVETMSLIVAMPRYGQKNIKFSSMLHVGNTFHHQKTTWAQFETFWLQSVDTPSTWHVGAGSNQVGVC